MSISSDSTPHKPKPHAKPRPKIVIQVYLRDDPELPWSFEAEAAWVSTRDGAVHVEFDHYYRRQRRHLIYRLDLVASVEVDTPRGRFSDVEAER